jgi:hypothetical protein
MCRLNGSKLHKEQGLIFEWKKRSGHDMMEMTGNEEGTVGTPEYIAPEIFLCTGHGKLPVLLYWT